MAAGRDGHAQDAEGAEPCQTIILVTHDAQVAAAAQRIVRMLDGRIAADPAAGAPAGRAAGVPAEAR